MRLRLDCCNSCLIGGHQDRTIKLWQLFPQVTLLTSLTGHRGVYLYLQDVAVMLTATLGAVNAVKVQNGLVASVSGDRQARIWCTKTYECQRIIEGHTGGIASVVSKS